MSTGSTDAEHKAPVLASLDGMARFYPPPDDWGTVLSVSCTLDGVSEGQFTVDLNDSSTFQKLLLPELRPQVVGMRPALTGDLTSISVDTLSIGGYPPRPDPVATPDHYARWVQKVTRPMDIYSAVSVARIGYQGSTYVGRGPANPWNGFVQTSAGFTGNSSSGYVANFGGFYQEYEVEISVPLVSSCSGNCNTLLWAGIGGYTTQAFGLRSGGLIQSGFNLVGNGISNIQLYYEYANGWSTQVFNPPGGDTFNLGDQFTIWGWSASNSGCAHSTNGAFACFGFEDDTNGWYVPSPMPLPVNGDLWLPSTADYVAEESSWSNADYWFDEMQYGLAWDYSGTVHPDPSFGGTDPYVIGTTTGSSGSILNIAEWSNGTFDTPASPMFFIWNASN